MNIKLKRFLLFLSLSILGTALVFNFTSIVHIAIDRLLLLFGYEIPKDGVKDPATINAMLLFLALVLIIITVFNYFLLSFILFRRKK